MSAHPPNPLQPEKQSFRANDRFDVLRQVGAGAMGVVYEAWDKDRNTRVALKTLTGLHAQALQLFKNEFRALADVSHPNLAALHELFFEDQWFFSMEYVDGGHFLDFVRPGGPSVQLPAIPRRVIGPDESTIMHVETGPWISAGMAELPGKTDQPRLPGHCDTRLLRASLEQLARAVLGLHDAGILHRDLKPLNVKVTPEGRVVVLDFGLAAHTGRTQAGEARALAGIVGTVNYMSPEQAAGSRVTEATDWYSVGVMVYEALTGHRPFEGSAGDVVRNKQQFDAPRLNVLTNAGEEWDTICAGLLKRETGQRMGGAALLAVLNKYAVPALQPAAPVRPAERIFVGREPHLALLAEAFGATKAHVPSVVFVHGKSGIGKTSLLEHFLSELAGHPDVVILAGRCYERESMPYKSFDGVVDALAHYMAALPRQEMNELTPRDAAALAQVFPVMGQVESIASAPLRSPRLFDQYDLRRKAFAALRELFARLGDRRRVVIYIDDLQWGDVDSVTLLREILRPPDAPAFLFAGAYRSEYEGRSPALDALLSELPAGPGFERRDIPVGPLTPAETRALAMRLLRDQARDIPDAASRMEEIARESEGSPYLLQEIASGSNSEAGGTTEAAGRSLDAVLYKRIAILADKPRKLLETVSVSVRPLGEREAFLAAGIGTRDPGVMTALRSARLIRGNGGGEIEPYHDRVRETVLAHLDSTALAQCHLRLATTLEASFTGKDGADTEAAAVHFEGAGEKEKASQYYSASADRASAALAFKHAASLCQRALDLSSLTGENRRRLIIKLADALGNAGRGPEAARAYRDAAQGAHEPEIFELERKEAYWFASSGHLDEGREALQKMLRRAGLRVPGPFGQLAGIVVSEVWLALRGIGFRERPESAIPRAELDRLDVYWDATRSFGMIDVPAAIYLTPRCLLLALRTGEIGRIARILALHCIGLAGFRIPFVRARVPQLLATCGALSERADSPYLNGMFRMAAGMIGLVSGLWRESLKHFREAERIFSQECAGVAWELATVRTFSLWALVYYGGYAELCRLAPLWSQEGADRGDLFQAVSIDAGQRPLCELVAGRPDAALQMLEESLKRWTQRNYSVQLAIAVHARTSIYLYQGEAVVAWEFLGREWPGLKRNHYLRLSGIRQWCYSTRAQSALALACTTADFEALVRSAERDARKLEGDGKPFARALAGLVRAGCASIRGAGNAIALLEKAVADLDLADMAMIAAAARHRLGELTGGETGQALIEQSELAMRAEGVVDPARMTAMFANGFSSSASE